MGLNFNEEGYQYKIESDETLIQVVITANSRLLRSCLSQCIYQKKRETSTYQSHHDALNYNRRL